MRSGASKPAFHAVVETGLRDVGVETSTRRHALFFGKAVVQLLAIALSLSAIAVSIGAPWIASLAAPVGIFVMALQTARRGPVNVVKLSRARWRIPAVLSGLRGLLSADEAVLGDAIGAVAGARGWHNGFRMIAATDRRLIVVPSARSEAPFPVVDVPYERVRRFGIEWKHWGRSGELSFTVTPGDGGPDETHVIASAAPANLVSVAAALRSRGVAADDPAAVVEAERAWDEARLRARSRSAPDFDRGLWMLLRLAAAALYLNSFGVGLGMARDPGLALLVLPVVCGVCGYVAGSKQSLRYLIPLNLLVSPTFFFADPGDVFALMLTLSALAALGLLAGSALGRGRRGPEAYAEPEPSERPPRGSVQEVFSSSGLIRLSGVVLAGILTLALASAAMGLELSMVRLAVEEMVRDQKPVDGRSNLTGGTASLTYTRGPDLHEFVTDNAPDDDPTDGARWELRSSFKQGYNFVSLASYRYDDPRLDNPQAVERFVAKKDGEHDRLAGSEVTHTKRVVDGRTGYVWNHGSPSGYWYYAAWFPHADHTIRVECMARREKDRFKRLCAEAVGSLQFRR